MTAHYPGFVEKSQSLGVPVEVAQPRPAGPAPYRNAFKRLIDIILVLAAAPVVVPLVLLLALMVSRDGHGPFFRQARVGRGGRIFTMLKLRTMVPDAERRLQEHLATDARALHEWTERQKLQNDPRITPIGRILRKTSLDELPQLWNVLTGDMSLVGPRPMMPQQQDLYPGQSYYALRPGVTGLWQVSDRNLSSFADRARFDDAYERRLSLTTDAVLLLATVRAVVRGTGH